MTRRMGAALPLVELTEKEWDAQLFSRGKGLATVLGWTSYHTLRSKGSASGFPDRTAWRDRLLLAELKAEQGKPSFAQTEILTSLANAGCEVYLWRPSDLEELSAVLAKRWRFENGELHGNDRAWTPGSLWLPAGHRHDAQLQQELVA